MHALPQIVLASGGIWEGVGGLVALAGSFILVMMLVALGTYAYKHLRGDGIEWPEESPEEADDGDLQRGSSDDEWDYY